jgi:pimeloyl-ACP methyl ester carboxylesterase
MTKTVGVLLTLILVAANSVSAQEHCRRVLVDGLGINACVSGEGPETVVLAAGAGQTSRTWGGLVPELSMTARVITFDRPGLGQSDRGLEPRTPTRMEWTVWWCWSGTRWVASTCCVMRPSFLTVS